jgi:hypothetical protein
MITADHSTALNGPRIDRLVSMNNQDAFDFALLHLLNQGHRCVSSSGRNQLRGPRGGKSAIGALIPDRLYWNSMEGKTVQQLLAATGHGYDPLREHLAGVAPRLLHELEDLHDRAGSCMPSLFREIVMDGGHRIARMFGLSIRMLHLWAAYRKLHGPVMRLTATVVVLKSVAAEPRYSGATSVAAGA